MPSDLKDILRLQVPIIVEIGARPMSLENVLALGPGSIIELSKGVDEELEIKVNNKRVGSGVAVKVGENFGVQVNAIGGVHTRINALSPDDADDSPRQRDADTSVRHAGAA